jgi:hypothetical protein
MLVNITIQTFKSENDLALSVSRWDTQKGEYMPRFKKKGLHKYSCTRIWNKKDKYQLAFIFEYQDEKAMMSCLPLWKEIELEWQDKIENITTGYRGILIDEYV